MSTKIFDAYILPPGQCRTTRALLAYSHRIRRTLAPISERLAYSAMAARLAQVVDGFTLGLRVGNEKSAATIVREEVDRAEANIRSGRRDVSWNFNLEWLFLITPPGQVVIKLFGESRMCQAFTNNFPRAADYHFQNSSECSEGITAKAWAERRRNWDKMLIRGGAYCTQALSMKLWGDYDGPSIWNRDLIMKHLPSLRARSETMAREVAVHEWLTIRAANRQEFDSVELFAFLRTYGERENDYLRRHLVETIAGELVPRITNEHLAIAGEALNPAHVRALKPTPGDLSLTAAGL